MGPIYLLSFFLITRFISLYSGMSRETFVVVFTVKKNALLLSCDRHTYNFFFLWVDVFFRSFNQIFVCSPIFELL